MKRKILTLIVLCSVGMARMNAQQTDPILTTAIGAQAGIIKQIHDERSGLQKKIIASQELVNLSVEKVHDVEKKMLSYLSNVQGAMQNLYQIKRAGELVIIDIPKNTKLLQKSIPKNWQGTFVAAIVSNKLKDIKEQATSLYPFLEQLVTSGTYNVPDGNGGNKKHKVNLLNSAERYYIANEVLFRLERINTDLYVLAWQVKCFTWRDLWFKLDPSSWCMLVDSKNIARQVIADWKKLL